MKKVIYSVILGLITGLFAFWITENISTGIIVNFIIYTGMYTHYRLDELEAKIDNN